MHKNEILTTHVYRKFEDTDRYLIEVAINDYGEIFNEWDPAPFKRRDIDPDLEKFLKECSREISMKHPLAIAFFMPEERIDAKKSEWSENGIRNHFAFNAHVLRKTKRRMYQSVLRNFVICAIFLTVATLLSNHESTNVLWDTMGQGLFIGGWVFGWEGVSTLVFKESEAGHRIREWERLHAAPIVFRGNAQRETQRS